MAVKDVPRWSGFQKVSINHEGAYLQLYPKHRILPKKETLPLGASAFVKTGSPVASLPRGLLRSLDHLYCPDWGSPVVRPARRPSWRSVSAAGMGSKARVYSQESDCVRKTRTATGFCRRTEKTAGIRVKRAGPRKQKGAGTRNRRRTSSPLLLSGSFWRQRLGWSSRPCSVFIWGSNTTEAECSSGACFYSARQFRWRLSP